MLRGADGKAERQADGLASVIDGQMWRVDAETGRGDAFPADALRCSMC